MSGSYCPQAALIPRFFATVFDHRIFPPVRPRDLHLQASTALGAAKKAEATRLKVSGFGGLLLIYVLDESPGECHVLPQPSDNVS